MFFEEGVAGQKKQWNESKDDFNNWKEGRTGMPLIDANMRELKQTGKCSTIFLCTDYCDSNVLFRAAACPCSISATVCQAAFVVNVRHDFTSF